ncbi:small integral membrane protein 12-A-like [Varroa jacobsoni]|uniref:Small integral membrane protein 12 n=1 Tax=Varroa destructor TaxID=109461 RepID=A0A7M7JJN0_VARDE|nr:small integral membrane protein 12-A-like [Varroa destructor]XP_022688002.1 small integral membrane protein 12-A-like [Varroa jacobsoni]
MWPLWVALRTYGPYITFPIAAVVGAIGYNLEGWMTKRRTPPTNKSIQEQRVERHLQNDDKTEQLQQYKTIFDKESNISPSLKS